MAFQNNSNKYVIFSVFFLLPKRYILDKKIEIHSVIINEAMGNSQSLCLTESCAHHSEVRRKHRDLGFKSVVCIAQPVLLRKLKYLLLCSMN